jgi:hypothetical protein
VRKTRYDREGEEGYT